MNRRRLAATSAFSIFCRRFRSAPFRFESPISRRSAMRPGKSVSSISAKRLSAWSSFTFASARSFSRASRRRFPSPSARFARSVKSVTSSSDLISIKSPSITVHLLDEKKRRRRHESRTDPARRNLLLGRGRRRRGLGHRENPRDVDDRALEVVLQLQVLPQLPAEELLGLHDRLGRLEAVEDLLQLRVREEMPEGHVGTERFEDRRTGRERPTDELRRVFDPWDCKAPVERLRSLAELDRRRCEEHPKALPDVPVPVDER